MSPTAEAAACYGDLVQVNFDPDDTTVLSGAFRCKPVAGGLLAVLSGGRRPDRYFAAYLMAEDLGLPLVEASVPVAGCVTFLEQHSTTPGSAAAVSSSVGLGSATGVSPTAFNRVNRVPGAAPPRPLPGSVTAFSMADPATADTERSADLAIRFSGAGRSEFSAPPPVKRVSVEDRVDAACNFDVVINGRSYGFSDITMPSCSAHGAWGTVYSHITLRRAITLDKDLYTWRMNIVNRQADVRTVMISHLSAAREVTRSWWIEGAWPVRWSGPSFNSMAAYAAMEEIELCISRFEWV